MELFLFLLTSAPVLLFVTGVIAAVGKSNLKIPDSLSTTLNIYLLLAIGLKGGMGLASVSFEDIALPLTVTLLIGILLPLLAFYVGGMFKFSFPERIAMAATFGSVSLVTYVAASTQLERLGIAYEPFMTTLVVVLEIPGLIVALLLYNQTQVFGITATSGKANSIRAKGEFVLEKYPLDVCKSDCWTGDTRRHTTQTIFRRLVPRRVTPFLIRSRSKSRTAIENGTVIWAEIYDDGYGVSVSRGACRLYCSGNRQFI